MVGKNKRVCQKGKKFKGTKYRGCGEETRKKPDPGAQFIEDGTNVGKEEEIGKEREVERNGANPNAAN